MAETKSDRRFWIVTAVVLAMLFGGVTWAAARYLTDQTLERAAVRLQLLNTLRKQALTDYFETAKTELRFWSINADMLSSQAELVRYWRTQAGGDADPGAGLRAKYIDNNPFDHDQRRQLNDNGDGSAYSQLHAALHPLARRFVLERGYYDFFLISPAGDVLYSVEKEDDFGTNLRTGPWRETGLAEVFRVAMEGAVDQDIAFSDLAPYRPSNDEPAMFMAQAMKDSRGDVLGVLALQLPVERIGDIMHFRAGMGVSGETYLVGKDLLMRSDSRFAEKSTVLRVKVDTDAVERALAGDQGFMIMPDYRGIPVLSAYDSIEIDRERWAILAEIDEAEVLREAADAHPQLAGVMLLLYALGLGSVWFLRGDAIPADEFDSQTAMGDSDFHDMAG